MVQTNSYILSQNVMRLELTSLVNTLLMPYFASIQMSELNEDIIIFNEVRQNNNEDAFERIFTKYHKELFQFVYKNIRHKEATDEIVQDIFVDIWERRHSIHIHTSLKAYLFTAAKNRSINFIKKQIKNVEITIDTTVEDYPVDEHEIDLDLPKLEFIIVDAINALPPKCKSIFLLKRESELSCKDISTELNISIKTVEAQMGIALKKIRDYVLKHWETSILITLLFIDFLRF